MLQCMDKHTSNSNMYSNIPTAETRNISNNIIEVNMLNTDIKYELLTWYDVITKQNYFSNKGEIIIQNKGFIMCAPSSATLSEIFLQYVEFQDITTYAKHHILHYFHYTDETLIIFDTFQTNINSVLKEFIHIHPELHFIAQVKNNNIITYLYISMHRLIYDLSDSINRKPNFTDTVIPYTSCHSPQHKYTAVRFKYD